MNQQHSGSWTQDRDEGEDEQVLQPKIKRKRSIRLRPQHARAEEKPSDRAHKIPTQLSVQIDNKYKTLASDDRAHKVLEDTTLMKPDKMDLSIKNKRNLPSRRNTANVQSGLKSGRVNYGSALPDDGTEYHRETLDSKVVKGPKTSGPKMSEAVLRKVCCWNYFYFCGNQFDLAFLCLFASHYYRETSELYVTPMNCKPSPG